jgi:hypothetical protein
MKNVLAKLIARRAAAGSVNANESAKTSRKQPAPALAPVPAPVDVAAPCAPAVCELCEADWGALSVDDIAELLVASGRFPEEEREALLGLPRELLVSVFCGCSAKLRLAPPHPSTTSSPRRPAL